MKKVLLTVLVFIAIAGCSSTPPAAPVTGDSTLIIAATLSRQETDTTYGQTVYMVMLMKYPAAPVSGADVTVSGPGGVTKLAELGSGSYGAQFVNADVPVYYQFNQNYTVTVVTGGNTYSAVMRSPGSVAIPSDGSTVSWLYEGNMDQITVAGPSSSSLVLSPDQVSPVNLNASGIYSNGAGNYFIQATITKQQSNAFSGSNVGSSLIMVHQYNKTVVR